MAASDPRMQSACPFSGGPSMSSLARSVQDPQATTPAAPPDPSPEHLAQLFDSGSAERYHDLTREASGRVARRVAEAEQPLTGATAEDLRPGMADVDLDRPLGDPVAALDELEHLYLDDAVYFHHRRYMGHLNCPVVLPALMGESVLSAI